MNTFQARATLALCSLALSAAAASAAPVLHVNNGVLEGASGVIVNGMSYEVSFIDGSCVSLYGGCTDTSQFTFHTRADAVSAMSALSDQVWGSSWGAGNLGGCETTDVCATLLQYGVFQSPFEIETLYYYNYANPALADYVLFARIGPSYYTSSANFNNAVWRLSDAGTGRLPEPASLSLAALALGVAGVTGRRRRRPTAD